MTVLSNDNADLTPRTSFDGPGDGPVLEFDFPAFEVGVAEYDEGPTGCTVFHFPKGALTAIDVRGGYPGIAGNYEWNHAICLSGGSLLGLEACSGVTAELFAKRDFSTEWGGIPLVSGAIIYDYGPRGNAIYPDKALGRAAIRAAVPGRFPLGRRGAGRSATVGKLFDFAETEAGGQGGALRQFGETKVAVFTVVNALGAVVDRAGTVVRGNLNRATGTRSHPAERLERMLEAGGGAPPPAGNTTLTVLVTNQRLSSMQLRQLGRQVHSSMARAIQPFHGMEDGDVLFAVTTNEVENAVLSETKLGVAAAEVAWDAVLSAVAE